MGPETGHFDGSVSNWSVVSAGPPAMVIEKKSASEVSLRRNIQCCLYSYSASH
jgi:hypothetical protein